MSAFAAEEALRGRTEELAAARAEAETLLEAERELAKTSAMSKDQQLRELQQQVSPRAFVLIFMGVHPEKVGLVSESINEHIQVHRRSGFLLVDFRLQSSAPAPRNPLGGDSPVAMHGETSSAISSATE